MLGQMENHQVIAENIAAASVPGFRRNQVSFESYLDPAGNKGADPMVSQQNAGTQLWPPNAPKTRITGDFTPGAPHLDGNAYHLAITGNGFFAVALPDDKGTAYTRNGQFQLNPLGEVVTLEGWKILDENGLPVTIPNPSTPVRINENGEIFQGSETVGKLQIANFKNPSKDLMWAGASYFQPKDNSVLAESAPVSDSKILQGYLEGSNVNSIQEMVSMIQATRAYEANQKALQSQDTTLETVIRQVPTR